MAKQQSTPQRIQWTGVRWISLGGLGMWWPGTTRTVTDPEHAAALLSRDGFTVLAEDQDTAPTQETAPDAAAAPPRTETQTPQEGGETVHADQR